MSDESSTIIQEPSEQQLDRDTLFDQVKESTERNRNFFFIWIAFALYVIATTVATTDLQLLLPNSTVTLPTIGLQLPLIGYFLVTPWLVLIIHFNLLHNLDTHAHKLALWAKHFPDEQPPRALLQAFIFDLAMLEQGATFGRLTRMAGEMLCYALGPITIGILLWRFTDYQDVIYTLIHFTAFIASIALTIKARNRLPQFRPESPSISLKIWPGLRLQLPYFLRTLYRAMGLIGLILTAIVMLETAWVVELNWRKDAWLLNNLPQKLEPFAPRLVIPPNTSLINLDGNLRMRVELDGYANLKDWWDQHGDGPDLKGRSLQAARLVLVDMRKAHLDGANMQLVDLFAAQLQGATLEDAQLQGADLCNAALQGASLFYAQLQRAELSAAHLQGANLSYAQLQGADLQHAKLQGANLSYAQLQGAGLQHAQLQGAIVDELKQIPEEIRPVLLVAWDKARKQQLTELQRQLDSDQTPESNYSMVADGAAPYICGAGVEVFRYALWNWVMATNEHTAAILADAMLQEIACKTQLEAVCKAVKVFEIPIKNRAVCNLPPEKSQPKTIKLR